MKENVSGCFFLNTVYYVSREACLPLFFGDIRYSGDTIRRRCVFLCGFGCRAIPCCRTILVVIVYWEGLCPSPDRTPLQIPKVKLRKINTKIRVKITRPIIRLTDGQTTSSPNAQFILSHCGRGINSRSRIQLRDIVANCVQLAVSFYALRRSFTV